ncbi:MAG: PAS domain S-box protein [Balneolaceae bacterium]|nr:PAS domain S-box protein [Balneolaceae bacterium]MCH8548839.1 PAS domain S-box protein [Balneolaceae bacterium]
MSRGTILKGDTGKPEKIVGVFHDITEAENVKSELKRSKSFYETLVSSVDGIVWEADADTFEFKYISPQVERILGYSADEWCSVPDFWESKIIKEDRKEAIEFCQKETQAGKDHVFEYRMFNADGEIVWVRDKVTVLDLEDGTRLLRGLILDITDQKNQEEKLQKSEARLKGIVESPTNYLIRIDIDCHYTFYNQNYFREFGWTYGVDDLTGIHYGESVMPYHRELIESVGRNAVNSPNKVFQVELDKRGRSGAIKTTLWSMHCIADSDNNPSEIQCVGIDITDRQRAMELLELNERKYKSMVQDGSDIIGILDDLGNYNYVCPSVERVLGYKPSDLVGENCMQYIHPDDQDRFIEILKDLPEKKRFTIDPYRFKAADGSWFWLETSVTNLMDDPAFRGVIANSRDITQQVEREEQIRSSLDEKKELLAEKHHRVKNNLAVVSSMMQLQAYEETDFEMERKLYDSMSRIKTMATIHELLYKSQSFSKLNFPEMVEQLIHSIDETFSRDTEVDIQIDTPSVELNINQAIPCSLIINEIVTNIYKHAFEGREKGRIQTCITIDGDFLTLLIEDDGVGFKPKVEPEKGSSLGMQLIRVLSQQLGGTFSFDSTASGVTFKLIFERSEITGISTQGVTDA